MHAYHDQNLVSPSGWVAHLLLACDWTEPQEMKLHNSIVKQIIHIQNIDATGKTRLLVFLVLILMLSIDKEKFTATVNAKIQSIKRVHWGYSLQNQPQN